MITTQEKSSLLQCPCPICGFILTPVNILFHLQEHNPAELSQALAELLRKEENLRTRIPTVKDVETELAYLKFRKEHYIPKSRIQQFIENRQTLIKELQEARPNDETIPTLNAFFELEIKDLKGLLEK